MGSHANEFELGEALDRLIKSKLRSCTIIEGVITAVNTDFTCDITVLDTDMFGVPMKVLSGTQASLFEIATVGTQCLVEFKDGNLALPQILFIDQGDKLLINYRELVQFNAGTFGGMVKVIELTSRLNIIENAFNNLVTLYNGHVHSGVTTGTGVSGTTPSQDGTNLTPTVRGQIEDTTITH